MSWKTVGDIAFYVATASALTFALLYFFLAPWRKTMAGRNIMAVMGTFAVAFAYFAWVITIGGRPPGFDVARAFLFLSVAASIGWRTVIFIKYHVLRSLRGEDAQGEGNELEDAR